MPDSPVTPQTNWIISSLKNYGQLIVWLGGVTTAAVLMKTNAVAIGASLVPLFLVALLTLPLVLWLAWTKRPASQFEASAAFPKELCVGRSEEGSVWMEDVARYFLIVMRGESGAGKSTFIRNEFLPRLAQTARFRPIYVPNLDGEWDTGPIQCLARALGLEESATLADITTHLSGSDHVQAVIVFDQIDDYQSAHPERFLVDNSVLSPPDLEQANAFWASMADLMRARKVRCMFVVADKGRYQADSFRFLEGAPPARWLGRLRRSEVERVLDTIVPPGTVRNPDAGWTAFRTALMRDLEDDHSGILPARMAGAFRGLAVLDRQPIRHSTYEQLGGVVGLELRPLEQGVVEATKASGLDRKTVLHLLQILIDPIDRDKTRAVPIADLVDHLSGVKDTQLQQALMALENPKWRFVRKVGSDRWRLDHDFHTRLIRLMEHEDRFLNLLARAYERFQQGGAQAKAKAFLTAQEWLDVITARLKGKLRFGPYRWFFLANSLRLLVPWPLLFTLLAAYMGWQLYLGNKTVESVQMLASLERDYFREWRADDYRRLASLPKPVRLRLISDSLRDAPNSQDLTFTHGVYLLDVLVGFEEDLRADILSIAREACNADGSPLICTEVLKDMGTQYSDALFFLAREPSTLVGQQFGEEWEALALRLQEKECRQILEPILGEKDKLARIGSETLGLIARALTSEQRDRIFQASEQHRLVLAPLVSSEVYFAELERMTRSEEKLSEFFAARPASMQESLSRILKNVPRLGKRESLVHLSTEIASAMLRGAMRSEDTAQVLHILQHRNPGDLEVEGLEARELYALLANSLLARFKKDAIGFRADPWELAYLDYWMQEVDDSTVRTALAQVRFLSGEQDLWIRDTFHRMRNRLDDPNSQFRILIDELKPTQVKPAFSGTTPKRVRERLMVDRMKDIETTVVPLSDKYPKDLAAWCALVPGETAAGSKSPELIQFLATTDTDEARECLKRIVPDPKQRAIDVWSLVPGGKVPRRTAQEALSKDSEGLAWRLFLDPTKPREQRTHIAAMICEINVCNVDSRDMWAFVAWARQQKKAFVRDGNIFRP